MAAMGGHGGANVSGTLRHQFSPRLWAQVSQSVLFPRITSVKANYTHDEMTFVTVNAIAQGWAGPPRMTLTLGRQLWPTTTGFVNYSTGFWALGPWGANIPDELALQDTGSMSVGVTNAGVGGKGGWTVEAAAGLTSTSMSADYTTFIAGLRLKLGAGLDIMDGLHGFVDGTARVTETTRIGAMIKLATSGVRLVFHFGRVGQRIRIPILLSFDANPHVVFWSTVLPIAGWAGFYHWWMLPRKQKRIERRIKRLRSEHAEYIAQKRQEAADAILLMERQVATRTEAERARNGLVILDAHYGRASAFTPRGMREETEDGAPVVIDVTVPLQALVASSKLFVPAGPAKYNLLGFYDPCIGENKRLRVRYLFQGRVHEVEVDDVSALRAPVKSHAVEE
jgi:DnaJ family protein C protein 11